MKKQLLTFLRILKNTLLQSAFGVRYALVVGIVFVGLLSNSQAYSGVSLIISEVYVYGSDEYIELTNTASTSFQGVLDLTRVKRGDKNLEGLAVTLDPGESYIIANTAALFDDPSMINYHDAGLSLTDTKALDIDLVLNGETIDTFEMSASQVQDNNGGVQGERPSFHKYFEDGERLIEVVSEELSQGLVSDQLTTRYGNPTLVWTKKDDEYRLWTREDMISGEDDDLPGSGDDTVPGTGDNIPGSGDSDVGVCGATTLPFELTEIYNGDQYADYLELYAYEDRSGSFIVSGEALVDSLTINIELPKHTHTLIASSTDGLLHDQHIHIAPDLSLASGTLVVMSEHRDLVASYLLGSGAAAHYPSTSSGCHHDMTTQEAPSPGFDRQFLSYIGTEIITETVVEIEYRDVCSDEPGSGDDSDSGDDTPSDAEALDYTSLGFSILGVDYSGLSTAKQDITISYDTGDETIDLSKLRMRIIDQDKRDNAIEDYFKNKLIEGLIEPQQEMILSKKFGMFKTKPTCVQLVKTKDSYYADDIIYDEYCYDPSIQDINPSDGDEENIDYSALGFSIVNVDYSGPSGGEQSIYLRYDTGETPIDLSVFRMRVNGNNKLIEGIIEPQQTLTLIKKFGMLKTKRTCLELVYHNHSYDTYCYTPSRDDDFEDTDDIDYRVPEFSILEVDYSGPSGTEQAITISYDAGHQTIDLSTLRMRVNGKNKLIEGIIKPQETLTLHKKFGMLKTKPTCVELVYNDIIYDEYCYDPNSEPELVVLSGEVNSVSRTGLQLQRVLPNPAGRDIAGENELVALHRYGHTGQVMDKSLKLKLGRSSMSLSGIVLAHGETVFPASKAIPNGPSCIELMHHDKLIDRICYPQAPDDTRYYHPRLGRGPETIPQELMATLDFDSGELSALRLVRTANKKVCLSYKGLHIRCVGATQTSTSKRNRSLLTLNNAYIAKIHQLYYGYDLSPLSLQRYARAYNLLSKRIKSGQLGKISLYGASFNPQNLEDFVTLVYERPSSDYLLHELGAQLFGAERLDEYYDKHYGVLQ